MASKSHDDEYQEVEYLEDGYVNDAPGDTFFELEDDDTYDERERADRTKLLMSALLMFSIIAAVVLGILGIRAFNQASDDSVYADKTWVVQGDFKDLTPDLNTKNNVAVYTGTIPSDAGFEKQTTYRSELGDPVKVDPDSTIEFRGTQTGKTKSDFPEKVDGLLAQTPNGDLKVIRTGDSGEVDTITSSSVTGTRVKGVVEFVAAAVILGGGIFGALTLAKRQRKRLAEGL